MASRSDKVRAGATKNLVAPKVRDPIAEGNGCMLGDYYGIPPTGFRRTRGSKLPLWPATPTRTSLSRTVGSEWLPQRWLPTRLMAESESQPTQR